jgi:hypothetical protein
MERDLELVRAILLEAEKHPHGIIGRNPELSGFTPEQVGYHIYLMEQAGLVEAAEATDNSSRSPCALLMNLTWAGHDYLDAVRPPEVWRQVKPAVQRVGSMTLDAVKALATEVATHLAKEAMGLR